MSDDLQPGRGARKIALWYGSVSTLYVLGVVYMFHALQWDPLARQITGLAVGLGFVAITTVLLYGLTRRYLEAVGSETEHKSATERELRRSRDQLAAAQRIAHVGSWIADFRKNELRWSDEVYRIFGVDTGAFAHTVDAFFNYVHPDDRRKLATAQARALTGQEPLDVEHRIVRPDGEVRQVHELAEIELDADGRPLRQVGTVQDITERKQVEQELERRNRQQAAIAELGMDALRQGDLPALMQSAAAAAARLLDVEFAEVLQLVPGEAALPLVGGVGWRPGLVGNISVARGAESQAGYTLQENAPVVVDDLHTETRFRPSQLLRDHRVVSGVSAVIHGASGPWGVLGLHTARHRAFSDADVSLVQTLANLIGDLEHRHQAILVMQERNFLRRMAGEAASLGGWAVDMVAATVLWSPEAARLHDLPPDHSPSLEETIRFYVPEHRERVRELFRACLQEGKPYDEELQLVTAQGRRTWVRAIGRAERNSEGRIVRVHGALQDISERKQLESMLHQSQRLEAVGQLTGGVAHDFNNLLTVILGNADLLARALGDDERLRGLAETTRQAAERGAELTSRLLAYARQQLLEPAPTDVANLLEGMHQLLQRSLGTHVEIELARGNGPNVAMVDAARLESAVLNLCLNARDAMPGGGRLILETSNVELDQRYADLHEDVRPGSYVRIAVTDRGEGMAPEVAARAFEPFFTTKPPGQGSGLGLSMVYGFVKQSNGHVNLYSEVGMGTTIKLYLPCSADEQIGRQPERPEAEIEGRGELVLVVEDDQLVREFVATQVTALGYRVITASNGADAMALLQQRSDIDVLFTDVVMPGELNGPALAARALELRPRLAVLFTSGYTENALAQHASFEGDVTLLNKPYARRELARKLHLVLQQHAPRARQPVRSND